MGVTSDMSDSVKLHVEALDHTAPQRQLLVEFLAKRGRREPDGISALMNQTPFDRFLGRRFVHRAIERRDDRSRRLGRREHTTTWW